MTQEQIQKVGSGHRRRHPEQPVVGRSPDFSKGGSLTSNRENGGQYINLRNLGSNRLLVLVDGKRWTQSVDGYTDMSTIPSSMIERIEVLKDGASSIYGSDAIAGVVNIILKKRMEGGQLSLYSGANQTRATARSKDFSLTYGAGSDKASLMFGLSHTEQGAVWARDRDITAYSYGPAHATAGTGPWGRIRQVSVLPNQRRPASTSPEPHRHPTATAPAARRTRNTANYHDPERRRGQVQLVLADDVPDADQAGHHLHQGHARTAVRHALSTTAMYAQRESNSQVAGYPLNSMTQPKFPVYIDKDSYYNPYGNQVGGTGGQDLFFYRRTIEVPRVTDNENRTIHIDAHPVGQFDCGRARPGTGTWATTTARSAARPWAPAT
jgi:iron complex outermembrane receptor protein